MKDEGPPLETLTRRLADCPSDFLAEPSIGSTGLVSVPAVVSDLLQDLGGQPLSAQQIAPFQSQDAKRDRNRLSLTLIGCWLLHDEWFIKQNRFANPARQFFTAGLAELSAVTPAQKFVSDPDRREELVRLGLKDLGLRPQGETVAQAQDRLTTLSSVERQRVVRAARQAEERARAIREALVRKAAQEGADKYSRE